MIIRPTDAHAEWLRFLFWMPCLVWDGSLNGGGYGIRGHEMAHRTMYEQCVGPIPAGLELDHLCRVRRCIEPTHLEPVTHRENDLRGQSPAILRHHAGVCVRGHQITPDKQCRQCMADNLRQTYTYLRSQGYSPAEARLLRNQGVHRHAAGVQDLRGA